MYRVELKPRARRELERLPGAGKGRVLAALARLADHPRPRHWLKLTGATYRLRVGAYRIIYAIFDRDDLVLVGKIARREKDTYTRLEELF